MKFKCPKCGVVFDRDMRLKETKNYLTPKGFYRSDCTNPIYGKDGSVLCRQVKPTPREG